MSFKTYGMKFAYVFGDWKDSASGHKQIIGIQMMGWMFILDDFQETLEIKYLAHKQDQS